jgi:ketosteroid isomerase-like protein
VISFLLPCAVVAERFYRGSKVKFRTLAAGFSLFAAGWTIGIIDIASERRELLEVDAAFSRATTERGLEGFLSFFSEDAAILSSDARTITGKPDIRSHYSKAFSTPGFKIAWTPAEAHLHGVGELGYTYGTFQITTRDESGCPSSRTGQYCTIWRKQPDGAWKIILDIGDTLGTRTLPAIGSAPETV